MLEKTYFIINRRKVPVSLMYKENYIYINFGFNRKLIDEIKEAFENRHWCGYDPTPMKIWRVDDCPRNRFRIAFLQGKNPYAKYDAPIGDWETDRPLYEHQKEMAAHWYARNYAIFACEMGTGKSLAALDVCNRLIAEQGIKTPWMHIWYVGPKTGVSAIRRESKKWDFGWEPQTYTYNGLVTACKNWDPSSKTPNILIIDESSSLKNPKSQRSQTCKNLARNIMEEYGDDGYVVEMSGSPAPKKPSDWWHQNEVVCPGYLREGNFYNFEQRLSVIEERESAAGGVYPHTVTWKDDPKKCDKCGMLKEHRNHQQMFKDPLTNENVINSKAHTFKESVNEVALLHKRMGGLVLVQFKRDCLDLPEKIYETIRIKPTADIIRAARTIKRTSPRAITALTRLRQLSDGFQYTEEIVGQDTCPVCGGAKEIDHPVHKAEDGASGGDEVHRDQFVIEKIKCPECGGSGEVPKYRRARADAESPKDDALMELMAEQFEQYGRVVIWAGFTGSIDKIVEKCQEQKWAVLRYDKKTIAYDVEGNQCNVEEFLDAMDCSHPNNRALLEKYPKIAFVGHPRAGGMGLTLTSSPGCIYYSNDFSGEARIQSEDRTHRAGMDTNRGCVVYDFVHLATDQLVIDNLKVKKNLQDITMGELNKVEL